MTDTSNSYLWGSSIHILGKAINICDEKLQDMMSIDEEKHLPPSPPSSPLRSKVASVEKRKRKSAGSQLECRQELGIPCSFTDEFRMAFLSAMGTLPRDLQQIIWREICYNSIPKCPAAPMKKSRLISLSSERVFECLQYNQSDSS